MAGEKFIALEETSQEIKTAVEGVSTSVTELKEDVGDGAGTDLVARVANLATQVSNLQTAVEALASGGGGTGISIKKINTYTFNSRDEYITFTTGARAILLIMGYHSDAKKLNISIGNIDYGRVQGYAAFKVNQGDKIILLNATSVYITELQY